MNSRILSLVALTAFGITLAIVIGQRLSSEAMAVLLGVVVGVAASMPALLAAMWFFTRKKETPPSAPPEPQIIFVTSPASPAQLPAPPNAATLPAPLPAREFVVIGDDFESI